MNSRCEEFRTLIEQSLSGGLSGEEQVLLEEHLKGCDGCRRYLEELESDDILLRGYACLFKNSVSEAGRAVAASLTQDAAALEPPRRNIFMRPKFVLTTAAAVILIAVAIYSISIRTSAPLYARVLEEIGRARNVSFRNTYAVEGIDPFETMNYVSNNGIRRTEMPNGSSILFDHLSGTQLRLHPPMKMATITYQETEEKKRGLYNYLDWVRTMHEKPARYGGRGEVSGVETDLYLNDEDPYHIMRIWVDPETDLPVRAVFITTPHPDSDIISPSLHLSLQDFGGMGESKSLSYGASGGITIASTVTMDEFVWNSDLDPSLFDMNPPEDFFLDTDSLDVSMDDETDLMSGLELWTTLTGGSFPDDINDLSDQGLAGPMLIRKFNGDGDPGEELDEAMETANILLKGCLFAQEMKVVGYWTYIGKGVQAGDADKPVCWWRTEESESYRVIYGDLRVEDIEEKDLPKK